MSKAEDINSISHTKFRELSQADKIELEKESKVSYQQVENLVEYLEKHKNSEIAKAIQDLIKKDDPIK